MNLHLGCGEVYIQGWINIDLHNAKADVKADCKAIPYPDNSADMVLASHLLEHFDFKEAFVVLAEWKRVLKPGGMLIIEVPDLLEHCKIVVNSPSDCSTAMPGIYGFPWLPGHAHKYGYTPDQLMWTLQTAGFREVMHMPNTQFYTHLGKTCMRFECKK